MSYREPSIDRDLARHIHRLGEEPEQPTAICRTCRVEWESPTDPTESAWFNHWLSQQPATDRHGPFTDHPHKCPACSPICPECLSCNDVSTNDALTTCLACNWTQA